MTDDRGVELPATFTTPTDEYASVCKNAGLIDLSFHTQLELTGADTVDFLQGMVSNDVKALKPGQGCAAALLTEQGRLVADLRIYATESAVLLDVDTRIAAKTTAALERFIIADDVEIVDLGARQTTAAVQGPEAAKMLTALSLDGLPERELHHCEVTLAGVAVRIVRADQTGHGGYEIHTPSDRAADVWQALASVDGVQPVGQTALNMLRIEAGIPWYGVDMDEDRVVLEVGLEHAISFEKGCYLGQEVVERVSARGVRMDERPERESLLFDDGPETPPERRMLVANSYGFAEWFKEKTPAVGGFPEAYAKRASDYERRFHTLAEGEDLPEQEPAHHKSPAVIALQLIKRWCNVRYDQNPDGRPPSVMISKMVADFANRTDTLSEELLHQVRSIKDEIYRFHNQRRLIHVVNPVCKKDVFTDSWPRSLKEQSDFLVHLDDFVKKLEFLRDGCDLREMKKTMVHLFGEAPTGEVFKEFNETLGKTRERGKLHHNPRGGRLDLTSSGIVSGVGSGTRPTRKSTFYGTESRKKK